MEQLTFKVEQFEGPLDLLEHLIKRNKLDICNISLIAITDQYIEYLNAMEQMDLEVSSDFLVVATDLLYIKSKALLPKHEEEEDPEALANSLTEALKQRRRMKLISEKFKVMQFDGAYYFFKDAEKIPKAEDTNTKKIEHGSIDKLYNAFLMLLEKTERRMPPPKDNFEGIVGREPASVKQKATGLVKRLRSKKKFSFSEAFAEAQHKNEIVAIFLAILELMKLNHIYVYDDDDGNIMLSLGEKSDEEIEYNFE
ncbi:MAG: segregation/condensation protein A [Clostridia bacterium]|nr:segregation/condensation protein A [Clostridia bacterium]